MTGTCDGGIFTYEKTTGFFLRTAVQEPLTNERAAPGITYNCSTLCSDSGSDCPAFAVDYGGQRCFKLDRNTQVKVINISCMQSVFCRLSGRIRACFPNGENELLVHKSLVMQAIIMCLFLCERQKPVIRCVLVHAASVAVRREEFLPPRCKES